MGIVSSSSGSVWGPGDADALSLAFRAFLGYRLGIVSSSGGGGLGAVPLTSGLAGGRILARGGAQTILLIPWRPGCALARVSRVPRVLFGYRLVLWWGLFLLHPRWLGADSWRGRWENYTFDTLAVRLLSCSCLGASWGIVWGSFRDQVGVVWGSCAAMRRAYAMCMARGARIHNHNALVN